MFIKLVTLFFLASQLGAAVDPAAEAAFQRGLTEEKYTRWIAAENSYKTAIAYDPNLSQAYRHLGYCYYHLGHKENCIKAYERYLQLVPGDTAMADYVTKLRATLPDPASVATPQPNAGALAAPAEAVQWHAIKGAEAESKATGKPIFYYCGGDWAAPSRRLTRQVFANADNAHWINQHFVPVNIEVPRLVSARRELLYEETRLLDHYFVHSVPTLIVEYPDGRSAETIHGSNNGEETMGKLKGFADKPRS